MNYFEQAKEICSMGIKNTMKDEHDEMLNHVWELFCNQDEGPNDVISRSKIAHSCVYFIKNHGFDMKELNDEILDDVVQLLRDEEADSSVF